MRAPALTLCVCVPQVEGCRASSSTSRRHPRRHLPPEPRCATDTVLHDLARPRTRTRRSLGGRPSPAPNTAPNKPRQCQLSSAHNGDVALIWDPSRRVRGSSRAWKVTFSSLARFGFLATFLLYAARLQRGPRPARPGAPLPTPALRPCSSAPQNPPQPMHRPARPLIAPLCRAGDAR